MTDFDRRRWQMVERQVAARGVRDPHVLAAMQAVPREAFVAADLRHAAYDDSPLPIEAGQTISQPYIVALMIEAAGVKPGDQVLEVGAGSGYAAAVMGRIARRVVAIERHGELARPAADRMARLGYHNVRVIEGDGTRGHADEAPYDAILVAATGRAVPPALIDQLAEGGVLVMPVGEPDEVQTLLRLRRDGERFVESDLGAVRFVPLVTEAA